MVEFKKRCCAKPPGHWILLPARTRALRHVKAGHRVSHFQRLAGIVLWVALISCAGCATIRSSAPLLRFDFSSPHMGTLFTISLYASDNSTAEKAAEAAFQRVASLDETMSDYRADSELMQLCEKPF